MPCINPDGKVSETAKKILVSIGHGQNTPEQIAGDTAMPLWWVRSRLRELTQTELVTLNEGKYMINEKGKKLLSES